jgi:hypothetical protein
MVNLRGKAPGLQGIETELDCSGNFVDVLTTWPGCPYEIEAQITFMDLNIWCNLNHKTILRHRNHLDKQQSRRPFLFIA